MSSLNIYCDESCHLPNDGSPFMVLGGVVCPKDHARDVALSLREVRVRHGLSSHLELKWTGVSPSKLEFFLDVVDLFWNDPLLRYRAVVAPKGNLDHEGFGQTHDEWYHKMYYQLLRHFISSNAQDSFRVYVDIKDTQSSTKLKLLHEVLCNRVYDFDRRVLENLQALRSHEVPLIQLTDFLTGAVSYSARQLGNSDAKRQVVEALETRSGHALSQTTWLSEQKMNIFHWKPQR